MRKHYGQVVKTCIKIAFASALLLIISGVLSYVIKGIGDTDKLTIFSESSRTIFPDMAIGCRKDFLWISK